MRRAADPLARLREHRHLAVWLFVALLGLASAERRLSEFHLNLRADGPGLESDDALDGDEIRIRLVAVKDERPPEPPCTGSTFHLRAAFRAAEVHEQRVLGPTPRGPPLTASST